jgi:N-acetylmuramoyl-L-alanine amidase
MSKKIIMRKFKRLLKSITASALCLSLFSVNVYALERVSMSLRYDGAVHSYNNYKITLKINNIEVDEKDLPMPPVIIDDRAYVPVKEIFTRLGAVVDWKPATREIYIGYGDSMIALKIGSNTVNNNGNIVFIPVPPRIINDKTMIPVRYAAEAFGFDVGWDDATRTVSVSTKSAVSPAESDPDGAETLSQDSGGQHYDDTAYRPITMETSVDNSVSEITAMSYPETRVTKIETITSNSYVIRAESEISRVEKLLLPDNRFVLDIYNAVMAIPENMIAINDNPYISSIRSAQNQVQPVKITRVVFDLKEPAGFGVSISGDRKSIVFSFENNYISGVSFTSDGTYDYLRIDGVTTPVVSVFPMFETAQLIIDLPLGTALSEKNISVSGLYANALNLSQYQPQTARVVLELNRQVEYEIYYEGNSAVVKLFEPNYRNIRYDGASKTIVIPKPAGMNISAIEHNDYYYLYKYMLTLPVDISSTIGYGEIVVKDDYLNSIEIGSAGGKTYITLNERRVLATKITDDASNIYIRLVRPKEVYDRIVVLDAGHGDTDPGSIGNGLVEKELTLDITLKIISLIEAENRVKVYATRIDDVYPDLLARPGFAKDIGDIFVSVHINSFTNPAVNGTEVWYAQHGNDSTKGISCEEMAKIMLKNMLNELGTADRGVRMDNLLIVLKNANIPAVICEIEYLSNPDGALRLRDEAFKLQAANGIYKAILEVFSVYRPAR